MKFDKEFCCEKYGKEWKGIKAECPLCGAMSIGPGKANPADWGSRSNTEESLEDRIDNYNRRFAKGATPMPSNHKDINSEFKRQKKETGLLDKLWEIKNDKEN